MNQFLKSHIYRTYLPVRRSLTVIGALAFVAGGLFLLADKSASPTQQKPEYQPIVSAISPPINPIVPTTSPELTSNPESQPRKVSAVSEVTRVKNPYSVPQRSSESVTNGARAAIVNILCVSNNPMLRSISGSGVVIDPRGVILTNAHVAQYVLLSTRPEIGISCAIRAGAPALARWTARVLYIPPVWVQSHAVEIKINKPTSTGEHDYALLLATATTNGTPLVPFPYLPIDTRESIAFPEDPVLVASYPAEFLGGVNAQFNLHPMSSITSVGQFYTFSAQTDLFSLGGIAEAQSGSSGGAVVNLWGYLVGLITATSAGDTTSDRDLRALSLNYIDRDLAAQTGSNLQQVLTSNVAAYASDFNARVAPQLIALYTQNINH